MKKMLVSYLLAAAALSLSAAEFKSVPTAEKIRHPDLSFCVTFDNYGTRADLAKGEADSRTMANESFLLRGAVGFDGKQAYQPKPSENLIYSAVKNADWKQGTLTMWIQARDYQPGKAAKRGNVAYAQLRFTQGPRYVQYLLYEYGGVLYWDWYSSEPPHRFGDVGRVNISLAKFRKDEWFQVAVTWDTSLSLYLNGELCGKAELPAKRSKSLDLQPDPKSFIGFRNVFHNDDHTKNLTLTDDCKIYSRALTPLEIGNQFNVLCTGKNARAVRNYEITLNGVDRGNGRDSDQIEAEFDFISLPPDAAKLYKLGKFHLDWNLRLPDKSTRSGRWDFKAGENTKFLKNLTLPGKYVLETRFGKLKEQAEIVRPDLSFIGNKYGNDDSVPVIWKDFEVNGRKITLWNRKYVFGAGPLPEQIFIAGKPLFVKPPRLLVNGRAVGNWKAGKTVRKNSQVTYTGSTEIDGGAIRYTTTVEFDGMIKFDWTVSGKPQIRSMNLAWQQAPGFHEYLMRPHVWKKGKGDFLFDNDMDNSLRELWMVSEKGGFAFAPVNDANWIYDPQKPVYHVDLTNGSAKVDLITHPVKMPSEVPYCAVFTATPTRPLPKIFRSVRLGDNTWPGFMMTQFGGKAFTGVSTYKPNWRFGQHFKFTRSNSQGIYGMADAMGAEAPEAVYFRKYWEIPGAAGYTFNFQRYSRDGTVKAEKVHTLSACNAGSLNDFYSANIAALLAHPKADIVAAIYFDLCGNHRCGNPLHGCGFKDKFGREIKTYGLLSKRELLKRTVRQAHAAGKQVWSHAQRSFTPMLNGLADFVVPGEQFEAIFTRTLYPFTDEIPELILRSELNRNVLGTGVICWSTVTSQKRASLPAEQKKRATEAAETMLLLYDIDMTSCFAYNPVMAAIWNIQRRYGIEKQDTVFHRFDRQKEITSSDPRVRISYYTTPGNHTLVMVCNSDPMRAETTIDLGPFGKGIAAVREEYLQNVCPVKNGKVTLKVPGRGFRILGIDPPPARPWKLDYQAGIYTGGANSGSDYVFDRRTGVHTLRKKDGKSFVMTAFIPVRPGCRYTLELESRMKNGTPAFWSLQGQFNGKPGSIGASSGRINGTGDWNKTKIVKDIPLKEGRRCYVLLLTLSLKKAGEEGSFRNITVTESPLKE